MFTCEEEIGGIGAQAFCDCHARGLLPAELDALKFIVEIDRRGSNDAVFYDCYNPEYEEYVTSKGFKTAFGSFSDISVIAPVLNVAAVNLSAGYYNAHRLNEYIVRSELERTIQKVVEIVTDSTRADFPRYEYDTCDYYSDDYLYETDEVPADLPEEYQEIYEALLDIYTTEQLDQVRIQYGNHILWQLYCDEFGSPFSR